MTRALWMRAHGQDAGEPLALPQLGPVSQIRGIFSVTRRGDGRGGKVEELEFQISACTAAEGTLADAWRPQEKDDRGR